MAVLEPGIGSNHPERFVGDASVNILSVVITRVYQRSHFVCGSVIGCAKQINSRFARFHAAGSVNTRAYSKNNIVNGYFLFINSGNLNDCFKALGWVGVDFFKAIVC